MKNGIFAASVLAVLSMAGCTSQSHPVGARDLLFSSLTGSQHLVWDFERDFLLDAHQVSALQATANGDSLMLAAKIVEQRASSSPTPASIPVALACSHPNLIVITSDVLTPKYVEQGCTIVRQI